MKMGDDVASLPIPSVWNSHLSWKLLFYGHKRSHLLTKQLSLLTATRVSKSQKGQEPYH